jgi:phosphoribosylformylglycinamidine synthase
MWIALAGSRVVGFRAFLRWDLVDADGRVVPAANPNGSVENIAGICNRERNVFGLMPHPDRACEERLGSSDGAKIFQSMLHSLGATAAAA